MLKTIVLAVAALSSVVFVFLFGRLPAFRRTPIGSLNHLFRTAIPRIVTRLDVYVTGGYAHSSLKRAEFYLSNTNHSLVLIFFIVVLAVSELLFIPAALPRLSKIHVIPIFVVVFAPYLLIFKASRSSSSIITKANHGREHDRFPYDEILYRPDMVCVTCHFVKPARSKHCSICNVCVSKHDHHCIWLRNCIGVANYGQFLWLLVSLGALLSYGAILAYMLLSEGIQGSGEESPSVLDREHTNFPQKLMRYFDTMALVIAQDRRIGTVGLLCLLTTPMPWGLFFYHCYLIWAGMTTNETSKWAMWRDDIADGLVVKKRRLHESKPETAAVTELAWAFERMPDEEISSEEWLHTHIQAQWTRVKSFDELVNIYDLGFRKNLIDAIAGAFTPENHIPQRLSENGRDR